MALKQNEIRELRLRLGWSTAELGRRMGCCSDTVRQWESGDLSPTVECHEHMQYLWEQMEAQAKKIHEIPVAEEIMKSMGIDQIPREIVLDNLRD